MKRFPKRKAGQAMVEYIIIVVVIAIAALVIFGLFGDTIKKKVGGAVDELDGGTAGHDAAQQTDSKSYLQDLGKQNNK